MDTINVHFGYGQLKLDLHVLLFYFLLRQWNALIYSTLNDAKMHVYGPNTDGSHKFNNSRINSQNKTYLIILGFNEVIHGSSWVKLFLIGGSEGGWRLGKGSVHVPGHLQGQEHAQGGESLERCQATLGQLSEGSGWQKTEKCVVKSPNLSTFSVRQK